MKRIVLYVLTVALLGCAPASVRTRVVQSANAASEIGADGEKAIAGFDRDEELRCLFAADKVQETRCIDAVRAKYEPFWQAYRGYRLAWFAVKVAVNTYDTAVALGQRPDSTTLAALSLELLRSAAELQAAILALHKIPIAETLK